MRRFVLPIVLACAALVAPRAQQPPTAAQVIDLANRELAAYAERLSAVLCVEHYSQFMGDASFSRPYTRTLVSEFALVRVLDDWLGFRDIYEVDGRAVRDRHDRLRRLFFDHPDDAISQARRINDESARDNLGGMQRNFNVPTMALVFLQSANVKRFTYRKTGEDRVEAVGVWKVGYEETQRPTIIRTSAGRDMPVKGTFWIDPLTGRVYKSHMELSAEVRYGDGRRTTSSASITVSYRRDASLDLLVPSEMRETYEGPTLNRLTGEEEFSRVNCRATYSDFKRFETGGRIVAPR